MKTRVGGRESGKQGESATAWMGPGGARNQEHLHSSLMVARARILGPSSVVSQVS